MRETIVVYGSLTGIYESIINTIAEKLGVEAINVSDFPVEVVAENDNLILGSSTWGTGELQDDWYDGTNALKGTDLLGKTVAILGCGDSESYSDTFCSAMKEIYDAAQDVNTPPSVSINGYTSDDSGAVVDGKFVGLVLDDVDEEDQTESRIDVWLEVIKPAL